MKSAQFNAAAAADLDRIEELYSRCKQSLLTQGVLQWGPWGNGYPGRDNAARWISRGELFVLRAGDRIAGCVALNQEQSPEWSLIQWGRKVGRPLAIHAFVIDPEMQGKGYGRRLISHCESRARAGGFDSLRLDAYPGNPASNGLYQKSGFVRRGSVFFAGKPEGCREYWCYEKDL